MIQKESSKEDFYEFMVERHLIWLDRFILENPGPWTTNPIFLKTKYTNVYRELDRNTAWFITQVACQDVSFHLAVYNTIVFTLINNPETMEMAGGMPKEIEELEEFWKGLAHAEVLKRKQGKPVFTNAYFVRPVKNGTTKMLGYIEVLLKPMWEDITDIVDIAMNGTPEEFNAKMIEYKGIGAFVAYEIYCNMIHLGDFFQFNDWDFNSFVNIGPGANYGLERVYGEDLKAIKQKDRKQLLQVLADDFPAWEKTSTTMRFPYLNEEKLHLRVIEHSLCEYHKYCRQREKADLRGGQRFPATKELDHDDYLVQYYSTLKLIYPHV